MKLSSSSRFWKGVLVAAIFLFAAVFSILSFLKYRGFEYNALDLAIFHQTLWSLAHHHGWTLTIHPPSYLGDHVGLFLILLAPLYRLFSSPATPLIAQSAAIALAAWPLYGIARTWLSPAAHARSASSGLSIPLFKTSRCLSFISWPLPCRFFSASFWHIFVSGLGRPLCSASSPWVSARMPRFLYSCWVFLRGWNTARSDGAFFPSLALAHG